MAGQKTPTALGTESIGKLLMQYAVPAIIAMTASSLYNMVDSIFIGHGVGTMAISGLALTFPLMNLAAAFGSLIGVGASTLISVKLGQKDYDTAQCVLGNVFVLNMVLGIAFTIIVMLFLDPILYFFGGSDQTVGYARDYMQIILLGNAVTLAFVNPGEQVLVPNPGYPTYTSLSKILGAEVVNYNLKEENGWMPDFDELEQMDMSRVKLMWTNYPNMPTGANATPELYRKLVDFARRKDIVIVNDNPYSFILNEHPISILSIPGAKECCIEFNSMSKSHNMPGWRIGMLASNADFVQWILKVKSNIDSGMFRAMQLAAATALEAEHDWYDGNNANYRNRRRLAGEIMHTLGCTYDENQVGMFLWGKIPDTCADVEELTERVLHKARVFITPGFIFGSNGKRYIRISLCCKDQKLAEALSRIKEIMN